MLLQNTCWSTGLFCFTSFLQSINNDPINRLNHLINNDMKLTADQPAKGSVNKCTRAAPSVTSSLLKLSISQYCISPVRLRITSVSSMFYPVNRLSEGKHVQEECQNRGNTQHTAEEDSCQNIGCVSVTRDFFFITLALIVRILLCHTLDCKPLACPTTLQVKSVSNGMFFTFYPSFKCFANQSAKC